MSEVNPETQGGPTSPGPTSITGDVFLRVESRASGPTAEPSGDDRPTSDPGPTGEPTSAPDHTPPAQAASTPDVGGDAATGDEPVPAGPPRRKYRIPREVRITVTLIVLVFVVEYFLLPEIATARKNFHLLSKVNPFLLILGAGLEVLSLLAYAQLTHTVLSPGAPRRFRLFRINMWSLSVSHVLPGGTAAGTAAGYRMLTESGVPGSTAAFGMALQGIGSAVVLNLLFWVALVISIPVNGFNPLYGTAAIAGTLLLAAFGASALLLTKGQHAAVDRIHRLATHVPFVNPDRVSALIEHIANRLELLLRDRRLLSRALLWAAANWLLDAGSLWVFLAAFGHLVSPVDLIVSYGLANILAAIPLTPGGLGVVEGVLAGTLTGFGVPGRIAWVAVLTWRLVNFWLPIPGGAISYLSLRFKPSAVHLHRHAGSENASHGTSLDTGDRTATT